MIIDRSHRPWIAFFLVALVFSTGLYVVYARSAPNGPTGGSWQGLWFGVAGTALMVLAGLLSARKKLPQLPIGSAQTWLKAHIWLGLLSVPLILFHAGFSLFVVSNDKTVMTNQQAHYYMQIGLVSHRESPGLR